MSAPAYDTDFVVIGSGFGGSVSALRLAEKGYRVTVLEQGRAWTPTELPATNWDWRRWLWRPELGARGFFALRLFRHVVVLHGNAVGGGSITYANTLLVPPPQVWEHGSWAGLEDWVRVMPAHYATAQRMLGVTVNRRLAAADGRLREMARHAGVEASWHPTPVAVFFGDADDQEGGRLYPDPYFDGAGPARRSCTGCGGCMVGCRVGAKNTLDLNYLHLAQRAGAQLLAETRVTRVVPLPGPDGGACPDGRHGYAVHSRRREGGRTRTLVLRARGVVCAAGALGTQALLQEARRRGDLSGLSPALGRDVRTNAESLIGVRWPGSAEDLSRGVAIGSAIRLDPYTTVEATRYPAGSDAMALLSTVMGAGDGRLAWAMALLRGLLTAPRATWRLLRPRDWARESMILLCMQTLDGTLTLRWQRPWWWPWRPRLRSAGAPLPHHIEVASRFARAAAAATGGVPMASLPEVLFHIPMTAHCLGGAVMAADPAHGVCDAWQRTFGQRNLWIVDGSVIGANLGVNPSLTIAALAERAMAAVPPPAAMTWDGIGTPVAAH
ncbi:Cholesterol oxidase [Tepidimonas sediminis]|uniref:Cholesterol oxidase n=1 Tax=Tepidimonas sediminis TaxID=2588941 RepID=A0A554WN81_9BURK|nr:GMC oxidoreductase [Tepidimonas sediminis]TSE25031.1 Cholesterol oxidase [Tepidimonas sediminis]